MRVKIQSDGSLYHNGNGGTTIKTADGQEIGDITSASVCFDWANNPNNHVLATLELVDVAVDVVADATMFTTVAGKRYKLVETGPG